MNVEFHYFQPSIIVLKGCKFSLKIFYEMVAEVKQTFHVWMKLVNMLLAEAEAKYIINICRKTDSCNISPQLGCIVCNVLIQNQIRKENNILCVCMQGGYVEKILNIIANVKIGQKWLKLILKNMHHCWIILDRMGHFFG